MYRLSVNSPVKNLRRFFLNGQFYLVSAASRFRPTQIKAQQNCKIIKDIYYNKVKSENKLDIISPKNRGNKSLPILMYIHGGGFTTCSKETHRPVGLAYADSGFVVFNVNYRLAPQHPFPAGLADVCAAYKWIIDNAESYGGDLSRVFIAGESAGANLALSLTIACCYKRDEEVVKLAWDTGVVPTAVQVSCGFLQVSDPKRRRTHWPGINAIHHTFLFGILQDIAEAYLGHYNARSTVENELADPLRVIESDTAPDRQLPAIFAMAGTNDIVWDDTVRLEKALRNKKTPFEVKYYEGEGHAFHFYAGKKATKQYKMDARNFLATYL